jgi:ankyrin repeat protein
MHIVVMRTDLPVTINATDRKNPIAIDQVLRAMLSRGADLEAKDAYGVTVEDIANRRGIFPLLASVFDPNADSYCR